MSTGPRCQEVGAQRGQVITPKRHRFWTHIWLNQWTTGVCLHLQSEVASMFTGCPKAQDGPTFPGYPLFHWTLKRKNPDLIPAQPPDSSLPAAPAVGKPRSGLRQPPFPVALPTAFFTTLCLSGRPCVAWPHLLNFQSPPGKSQKGICQESVPVGLSCCWKPSQNAVPRGPGPWTSQSAPSAS